MFGKGISGTADLKRLYDDKKWEELVDGVVSKRFVVNTYYFYLGAAAEGMGYPEAAHKYYEMAAKTTEKCSDYQTWTDTCVGFKFPGDALNKMAGLRMKGEEKNWLPGQGPTVSELLGMTTLPIEDLPKLRPGSLVTRDKFETDEEYQARVDQLKKGLLVVAPLETRDGRHCETTYDHAAGEYKISKCVALVGKSPLVSRNFEGDSIRLSNMMDSREIKRLVSEDYYIASSFTWSQAIKLSREEAKKIDGDLMVGVVSKEFSTSKKCSSCDAREMSESLNQLANSAAALNNKSNGESYTAAWKKTAFLKGEINDNWVFTIKPAKIERVIVYRRSDARVLYSFSPDN